MHETLVDIYLYPLSWQNEYRTCAGTTCPAGSFFAEDVIVTIIASVQFTHIQTHTHTQGTRVNARRFKLPRERAHHHYPFKRTGKPTASSCRWVSGGWLADEWLVRSDVLQDRR